MRDGSEAPKAKKPKLCVARRFLLRRRRADESRARSVITFDTYQSMVTRVMSHLVEVERETGAGVRRDELVQWYTEEVEETLASVEALERERLLIAKVLAKMVKEGHLLEVRGEGLEEDAAEGEAMAKEDEDRSPMLLVHPNSSWEE